MISAALDYSVVIPAHNAEPFMRDALASIAQQTVVPREIVVVDDGSQDHTADVARSCGAAVISTGRASGPSAARNRGVAATTSPVIAFLDADDEWRPDHAERVLGAMHVAGAVYGSTGVEAFGLDSLVSSSDLPGGAALDIRNELLVRNLISQSAAAVRRDAFVASGGYDESMRMAEDYDLWNRLALVGTFAYVKSPTVRRRLHPGQLTHGAMTVLVEAAWKVRRAAVARRWEGATAAEREEMLTRLELAAHEQIEDAIHSGDTGRIHVVRAELAATDRRFSLEARLSSIGGAGSRGMAVQQDLRCLGRGLLNRVRGRR